MRYQHRKIEHIAQIKGGKRLPKGEVLLSERTAHQYIRGQDIRDGKIICDPPLFISEECHNKIKNYTVKTGDICITIVGNIGDVGYVPQALNGANLTENAVKLVDVRNDCDPIYLKYSLLTKEAQSQMKNLAAGAAQPKLGIYKVKDVQIVYPDYSIQNKIAFILSAYDDLIENNNRRIRILEKMAQTIYKEWFVNFRFPGHKKVKMVKSKLGMIPEGWEIVKSSDAIEINPSIRADKDNVKPYVDMGGLSETSMVVESKEQRTGSNGSKYINGDTLFARITPCLENGKTGFVQFMDEGEKGIGSTEFIVLRSKSLSPEFVYLLARSEDFRNNAIKSMTGASGRQRVQPECFDKYQLAQPHQNVLDKFTEIVRPMFQSIHRLDLKNKNLRKTRDLLLPKLISGEIDVEGLKIETEQ